MPTLPQLVSLWIAILLGCACEEGKPSSHTRYVKACANGCDSAAGASAGASTVHGVRSAPRADSDEEPEEERSFDEPFLGTAGSSGFGFGGAGSAAVGGGGFAGFPGPPFGGAGSGAVGGFSGTGPTGGFGPVGGFGIP